MPKRMLTHQIHLTTLVTTASANWIEPTADLLWTPQQDILIVGVDFAQNFGTYTTTLAAAGGLMAMHRVEVTTAGSRQSDGSIAMAMNGFLETLQGAITPSGNMVPISSHKYVPLRDPVLVTEGNDVAVWQYQYNDLGSGINMELNVVIQYLLRDGGNY